ncbi:mediator of RNA polymerase II transcription subunit 27 [Quillaja saponaria]|uniref:Mediator of RNA polymerase II transcription subunit 27 n=1 Tax=Quillaja saponaria TaxID=32244 RepID=A0AAD7PYU5_QUISA|nr:mediator of RNA polymerase II transcription subunit 27 [Quillaja saponaria]
MQQEPQSTSIGVMPNSNPPSSGGHMAEAQPKQVVALALERLGQASRHLADVRIGADLLLEALFVAAQPNQSTMPEHLFRKEDASMRQHVEDIRSIGRQLQDSGLLNELLSNSWGLHMPVVCPYGAEVAMLGNVNLLEKLVHLL